MKWIQLLLFPFLVHTSATITLDFRFTDEEEKTKSKGTVGCLFFLSMLSLRAFELANPGSHISKKGQDR